MSDTPQQKIPAHIQILNWRQHGAEESYVRMEPFAGNEADPCGVQGYVEAEHNLRRDAEDDEDYEHMYYVNDDIMLVDGEVLTNAVTGRKFRVRIEEVTE